MRQFFIILTAICGLTIFGVQAATPEAGTPGVNVSLEARGVCITTPADGRLVLTYPLLTDAEQKASPPTGVTVSSNTASMRYANGAQLTATLEAGAVMLHWTALPAAVKGMRMEMPVPLAFKDGGQWQMEEAKPQPFPAQFTGEQFVFKGNPKPVKVIGPKGGAFTLAMPYGWQQMQDNRKWNDNSFGYMLATGLEHSGGEAYYTFQVLTGNEKKSAAPAVAATPTAAASKAQLALRLTDAGIAIDAGGMGNFLLNYPVLVGEKY
ncbi:MAG TPA: hypothetical protein VNT26_10840, partial [Candidatus Sulfotelmatobacter sp.]|nr:hypothetical protein [Candidatus Sulfotelmatobacter sp.]